MRFPKQNLFFIFLISLLFVIKGHTQSQKYKNDAKAEAVASLPTPSLPDTSTKKPEEENTGTESSPLAVDLELTSNYMFRGLSQNRNAPAAHGGLTYTVPKIGVYGYVWGSNVNFTDINEVRATTEIDLAIGISNTIKKFHYDFSYARYNYPHTVGLSYNEFLANAQLFFVTALIGYSGDVYASGLPGTYYHLGIKHDIPSRYIFDLTGVNVSAGVGHYSLPLSAGLLSYNDYGAQLSKSIKNYVLAFAWTDTNGKSNEEPQFKNNKFIVTIAASFS